MYKVVERMLTCHIKKVIKLKASTLIIFLVKILQISIVIMFCIINWRLKCCSQYMVTEKIFQVEGKIFEKRVS